MDKSEIRKRITILSLKTVKNGATIGEENAAKAMIAKLQTKLDFPKTEKIQTESKKKTSEENIRLFKQWVENGTIDQHYAEIDWDSIAKELLDVNNWRFYVNQTHSVWERREASRLGVIHSLDGKFLSEKEYRRYCYKLFIKL